MRANQPDIVIVDKDKKETTIIDITIPNDVNIREKNVKKLTNINDSVKHSEGHGRLRPM